MKQFYSYIKVSPNPALGDSIAIGILLYDGSRFRHYISESKKKRSQKLFPSGLNLDLALKGVISKSNEISQDRSKNQLFYDSDKYSNYKYFEYLSDYSNGILQFSKPNMISGEMNDSRFRKFALSLFNDEEMLDGKSYYDHAYSPKVERKLISRIRDRVHVDVKINDDFFPGLSFEYEMNVLGKNGSMVGAKVIDFGLNQQTIQNHLFKYSYILNFLSPKGVSENRDQFFLIANEPSVNDIKKHKIWESAKVNSYIEVLNEEESGKVADLILENNATTFLQTT